MSIVNGGADDLILWTLEINEYIRSESVYGSRPIMIRERAPDADLTLRGIDKEECEAVIRVINEMRSASRGVVLTPSRGPSIGDRFAGLEFE